MKALVFVICIFHLVAGYEVLSKAEINELRAEIDNFTLFQNDYLWTNANFINRDARYGDAFYCRMGWNAAFVVMLYLYLSKPPAKPKKPVSENMMNAEFLHPVLEPVAVKVCSATRFCICGIPLPFVTRASKADIKKRTDRICAEMQAYNRTQVEIHQCLNNYRQFVNETINKALGSRATQVPQSQAPQSQPLSPLSSSSPACENPPAPSLSPPVTRRRRAGSKPKTPRRPTLQKRESRPTPPPSPVKTPIKSDNERGSETEKVDKPVKGFPFVAVEESESETSTRRPSPPKTLAPRSKWEPSRAPSLSPRKILPASEFRTYSPTQLPSSPNPKMMRPGDLAVFVLRPAGIQDVKAGMQELNGHIEKLEKIGGVAALLKSGRLCGMCTVTESNIKARLRLLFHRNVLAALPSTKLEMKNLDIAHPRSLIRTRSRSASWTSSPLAESGIRPVQPPIVPISVLANKPKRLTPPPSPSTTPPPSPSTTPPPSPSSTPPPSIAKFPSTT